MADGSVVVRTSPSGMLFWRNGEAIWDNYVDQKQFQLTNQGVELVGWFAQPRPLASVAQLGDSVEMNGLISLGKQMLDGGILVAEGTQTAERCDRLVAHWRPWGTAAMYYNFSSRTLSRSDYTDVETDRRELALKKEADPAPPKVRRVGALKRFSLPEPEGSRVGGPLNEVLSRRRSVRSFGQQVLPLDELATLLYYTLRVFRPGMYTDLNDGTMFRCSPSGGGRHPVEGFLAVQRVEGIPDGRYHYDHLSHSLELMAGGSINGQSVACGGQPWVDQANVVLYYVGMTERSMWKYDSMRAYRVMLMDVGHLSQTAFLVGTDLGLAMTYTAALRDELLERQFGLDYGTETVLGASVIGLPNPVSDV